MHAKPLDMDTIIQNASPYISRNLPGEAVLTIGASLAEVVSHSCGVIAIGPFGCMPNRLSEAILNETMNSRDKIATDPENELLRSVLTDIDELPFLAIESDGSPFPQLINAKLETFCLRAERLHQHTPKWTPKINYTKKQPKLRIFKLTLLETMIRPSLRKGLSFYAF